MKARLEYKLPKEKFEYKCAVKSQTMWCILKDLQETLLKRLNNGYYLGSDGREDSEEFSDVEYILDWLSGYLLEEGIRLDLEDDV